MASEIDALKMITKKLFKNLYFLPQFSNSALCLWAGVLYV